jgi:hypothetical protein
MHAISHNRKRIFLATAVVGIISLFPARSHAQEPQTEANSENQRVNNPYPARAADGQRHGLPVEVLAVAPGTKFLVRLEHMSTKEQHRNQSFRVRTLEPLEAGQGIYLPAGAQILGHVSRVEPAGTTGRAKPRPPQREPPCAPSKA